MGEHTFRHFFFDLDNTLTRSKSPILEEHKHILQSLSSCADIIVVSGAKEDEIRKRIPLPSLYVLSQNGNHAENPDGSVLWHRALSPEQKEAIYVCIEKMRRNLALEVRDPSDLIEDRDCQIAYSLIGHHEDIEKKESFDPTFTKRTALLSLFASDLNSLRETMSVEVRMGGTTVLDFMGAGTHKGYNVAAFIEAMGWKREDAVYFGDALFPGGNDETVKGVIETRPVKDYRETFDILTTLISQYGCTQDRRP